MATNGTTDTQIISGINGSGTYLPLSFYTNNALAMQVATSGNVSVSTGDLILNNDKSVNFGNGTDAFNRISLNSGSGQLELRGYAGFKFYTPQTSDSSPRLTIDSSGQTSISNLSAYQTPEGVFTVNGNGCGDYIGAINNRNLSNCGPAHGLIFRAGYNGSSSASNFFSFRRPDNAVLGAITQNGASNISYATSSDYRLKENIIPMTGALAKVSALKPVTYTWKEDGSAGQGFIAHELQEVVPNAVVGEKDAVDEEGNPVYQGVDTSFLVATLTAAIQEQQNIIKDLTSRIEKLEEIK
jgi:hypothetical protein